VNALRPLALVLCCALWGCAELPPARTAADATQAACEERGEQLLDEADRAQADVAALQEALAQVHATCASLLAGLQALEAVRVGRESEGAP
jgi:hypothetical protein